MAHAPDSAKHGTNIKIRFRPADDLADIDVAGSLEETNSPISAAHGFDIAGDPKLVDHLHQMVLGDAITVGDLRDRRKVARPDGQPYQDAQRVVGVGGKPHRDFPKRRP